MLQSFPFLVCTLLLLFGCSTTSQETKEPRAPDWVAEDARPVPEPPISSPTNSPAPPLNKTAIIPPGETWVPLNRWSRSSGSGIVQSLARVPLPTFALSTTNGLLVLQTESQVARWDGVEFRFGFAPQLIDGQPFVHALDLQKNIMPLLNGASSPAKTNRVIILDPGHGGLNAGAKSAMGNRYEKEFTLDWARRLALLLAAHGWEVFLTRTNDVDVSLADRVAFAEQHEADLFVSLHFNSSSAGDEQAGLETYCLTPAGMPSTVTRGYGDDLTADFPNNAFDTENLQYALRLHQALLAVNGRLDRGVRRARFLGVLRGQNRPAVLIEGGYLSNPREAQRIGDPAYRQKLAEAAAGALE